MNKIKGAFEQELEEDLDDAFKALGAKLMGIPYKSKIPPTTSIS